MNDNDLRMEVVHMKELRHNNLITFAGACLEWPNVCVLTEICPKVILKVDSVQFYSILPRQRQLLKALSHTHEFELRVKLRPLFSSPEP